MSPAPRPKRCAADGASDVAERDYDAEDWWFRCRFGAEPGAWRLHLGGIATLADVWVNGTHVARSENMYLRSSVVLDGLGADNELVIRCEALGPALGLRRPRARWKTTQVETHALRWFRTDLLGRVPGWARTPRTVGPWKPVTITRDDGPLDAVLETFVHASSQGDEGRVDATLRFADLPAWADGTSPETAVLVCLGREAPFEVRRQPDGVSLRATLPVTGFERWWPHTHGPQPLYEVSVRIGDVAHRLGRVGFRTIEVDRADGGFSFVVNGVPVFVRGANWFPPDPVSFRASEVAVRQRLGLVREANLNMVRIPGTTAYADPSVLDACDELGILALAGLHVRVHGLPRRRGLPRHGRGRAATGLRRSLGSCVPRHCLRQSGGRRDRRHERRPRYGGYPSELFDSLIPSLDLNLVARRRVRLFEPDRRRPGVPA